MKVENEKNKTKRRKTKTQKMKRKKKEWTGKLRFDGITKKKKLKWEYKAIKR